MYKEKINDVQILSMVIIKILQLDRSEYDTQDVIDIISDIVIATKGYDGLGLKRIITEICKEYSIHIDDVYPEIETVHFHIKHDTVEEGSQ